MHSAPRADREAGFDATGLGLVRLRLGTWGPFLFACADHEAPEPAAVLADARLPFDPSSLVFRERIHYALDANWKIAVENYLECYLFFRSRWLTPSPSGACCPTRLLPLSR